MRFRFVAFALVVCGTCLFAVPQSPAPAEPQAEAVDFDALRALDTLQQSRERQLASVARSAFCRHQKLPWQEGHGTAVSVNQLLDRGLIKRFQLFAIQDGCRRAVRDTHPIT